MQCRAVRDRGLQDTRDGLALLPVTSRYDCVSARDRSAASYLLGFPGVKIGPVSHHLWEISPERALHGPARGL